MSNCSDLQNSFGLKSYNWLEIANHEKGKDRKCYYIKEKVDEYILRLKGDHEAKANKLKQEAKITMQDVEKQPGELDNHYYQRIRKELFDTDNRRIHLERIYSSRRNRLNQSALPPPQQHSLLPPLPPNARGIINKNQKKKRKSNKKRKTKKRKSKKRKTKKRKTNKKRNKTKKSKK